MIKLEWRDTAIPTAESVFTALVREVDAGRALIAMTPPGDRHRAAVAALALARDVLDDARMAAACAAQLELSGPSAAILRAQAEHFAALESSECTGPGRCSAGYFCPLHGPTSMRYEDR